MKRAFWMPRSRARIDAELQEEFRFHIEERIEQFMAEGMTRRQAELEVEGRFGDYDAHRALTKRIDEEGVGRLRRTELLRTIRREARHAVRALWRTPAFSLIAFITLALGIGATTAIYTVLDAVVLRPLGYRDAERLVSVLHPATVPGSGERKWGLSPGGYFQFRANNASFTDFAMYRNSGLTVTSGGEAEMTQVALVTASIFPVMRARASVGRLLTPDDDKPEAPRVAVLSHEFFQRRFAGDVSMIGKNLETSSGNFEIVGVAEPGLVMPMPGPFGSTANLAGFGVDLWLALRLNPNGPFFNNHPFVGLGRLKPGVTVGVAQRDLSSIFARFTELLPNAYSAAFMKNYDFRVEVMPLQHAVLGPKVPRTLWMLFGAVSLVLVIAAANVANLFLVRMEARRRESAIRAALGADRTQLAAHYLAESLVLCMAGAVAGLALAAGALRALLAIAPTDIPRLATVSLTWRSVAAALAVAALLGIVLGLVPMLRRVLDLGALREGSRGLSPSPTQRLVRGGLVVGQIAMSLMLLAGAGLMLRSFDRLRGVEPGFDATNTLVFDLSLPYTEYKTREEAIAFHQQLQRRLLEIPGVTAVGGVTSIPLEGFGTGCSVVFREGRPYAVGEQTPCISTPIAAPGAFDVLQIPVRGRVPTWNDVATRSQAVVVTKALGDRLWPGEDPIGKGIGSNGPDSKVWYRVVGVASDMRAEALDLPPTEALFLAPTGLRSNEQDGSVNDLAYLVRTNGLDPLSVASTARRMVAQLNPRVPVIDVRSMDDVVRRSMARTSFILVLLGLAAGVAVVLSAVGIYGVISYVVTQRRSEIGIRMALGATVSQVVRLVLVQSVWLAVLGVAIGLAGAVASAGTLRAMLFDVSPTDPVVLVGVTVVLLGITVVASLLPARRAARVDPAETMRAS